MRLVVDGFGKFIGVDGGLIAVKEKGKTVRRVKADDLDQILVVGRAAISSEAIKLLLKYRVDLVFLDREKVAGRLTHPLIGTVKTRREQYMAYNDYRSVYLSREFVKAKMLNQMTVLSNLAKTRKDTSPEIAEKVINERDEIRRYLSEVEEIEGEKIDDVREELLGLEGTASKHYWNAIKLIIPPEYGFKGRKGVETGSPRYAQDIVNAMFNYGYSILLSECVKAIELAGLDPYAGFLHVDVSGRSSLAIDFMENFRQHIVDRVVLRLISRRQIKPDDGEMKNFVFELNDRGRRTLISSILERLDSKTQYAGKNFTYSSVMLLQARSIVSFLRGERKYTGFVQRW